MHCLYKVRYQTSLTWELRGGREVICFTLWPFWPRGRKCFVEGVLAPEPVCRQPRKEKSAGNRARILYTFSASRVHYSDWAILAPTLTYKDFRLSRNVTVSVLVLLFLVRISDTLFALLTIHFASSRRFTRWRVNSAWQERAEMELSELGEWLRATAACFRTVLGSDLGPHHGCSRKRIYVLFLSYSLQMCRQGV